MCRGGVRLGLSALAALLLACASDEDPNALPAELEEPDPIPTAEDYYNEGLETLDGFEVLWVLEQVDYLSAIELFQSVIDNYPYSEYATLAELKLADIEFRRFNFAEAGAYYQDFVELHPTHEQAPYALYRQALCRYREVREADQDQTPTLDTIELLDVYLSRYPEGEHTVEARDLRRQARARLAQSEIGVGDFYFDRGECYAAYRRYRKAILEFPDHGDIGWTQLKLGRTLVCQHRCEEALEMFQIVLTETSKHDDELYEITAREARELHCNTS